MLVVGIILVGASVLAHLIAGAQFGGFDEVGSFHPANPDSEQLSPVRRVVAFLSWIGFAAGLVLIVLGIV